MSLTAAATGFIAFILSIQVIQGQDDWKVTFTPTEICALKGSTVEISCTYRHPSSHITVTRTFWFLGKNYHNPVDLMTDSRYAGRVQNSCYDKKCTLRITDLRESDGADYYFRIITNQRYWSSSSFYGVTLKVTGLQVKQVTGESVIVQLECQSSCHLPDDPSYVWYRSGVETVGQTPNSLTVWYYSRDSYSCAVKGHEDLHSPSVCVRGQTCNRVIYTERSICAFKGSSVDISCTYSSHGWITSKFWFSPELSRQWQSPSQPEDLTEDSRYKGRVQVFETERGRSTLRITDLRESDSAQYRFRFRSGYSDWGSGLPGTTLTVTALQVQVISAVKNQDGIKVELKCHSSCRPHGPLSYVWFNNGLIIKEEESSSYIFWFHLDNNISCAVEGREAHRSPSVYAPTRVSASLSPSAEIVEGSSVTLTCSSDANPAANYAWYKENRNPDLQPLSEEPQLVFRSIRSSDSGEYYCSADNKLGRRTSEFISIDVKYAPKPPSVSVSPSGEIVEGSSVTLTCSSDANPAANYTWYKENQTLLQGPEGIYHFPWISKEDSGIYHCKSENDLGNINSTSVHVDVKYAPKLAIVSVSPSGVIAEGSSVNLSCSSDANPAANYTWYKENEHLPKTTGQMFTISDVRSEHSGNYFCEAKNSRGSHNSTLRLVVAGGSASSVAAGSITAIFLAAIFISVFLLVRRKKSYKNTTKRPDNEAQSNMGPPSDSPSAALQGTPAEGNDDLYYASVSFSKHQEAVYCNIDSFHKNEDQEEEDEVDYTAVNFESVGASPELRHEEVVDSSALYSTVAKKPRA